MKKNFLSFVFIFFMGSAFSATLAEAEREQNKSLLILNPLRIKSQEAFKMSKGRYKEAQEIMRSSSQSPSAKRIIETFEQSTIRVFQAISKSITTHLPVAQKALEYRERFLEDHEASTSLALNAQSLLDSVLKDEEKLRNSAALPETLKRQEDRRHELDKTMTDSSKIISEWRQENNLFREEMNLLVSLKQEVDAEILHAPEKFVQIRDSLWARVLSEGTGSSGTSEKETLQQQRERRAAAAEKRRGEID